MTKTTAAGSYFVASLMEKEMRRLFASAAWSRENRRYRNWLTFL